MSYFGQPLYPAAPTTQLSLSNISGSTTLGAGPATYTKAFSITGAGSYTIALPALDPTNYPTASFSITNNAAALCTINVANSTADTMQLLGSSYTSISILPGERMVFQNLLTIWVVGLESASRTTTAPQFDNSIRTASTAFVQTAKGSFAGHSSYTTSQTLTAAQIGKVLTFYGSSPATFTLPGVSIVGTAGQGSGVWIANQASTATALTVAANGSDTIQMSGSAAVASITLNPGDSIYLCAGNSGTAWVALGGTSQLPYAATMSGANWTTPAQFDNSTRLATTAFVKNSGLTFSNTITTTGGGSLTAQYVGALTVVTGNASPTTLTLPNTNIGPISSTITILNQSAYTATVTAPAGCFIAAGGNAIASIVLGSGDSCILASLSGAANSNWELTGGSVQNAYSSMFGSSQAISGYQKLPGGLIIQWGFLADASWTANTFRTINYPIAFPTAALQHTAVMSNSAGTTGYVNTNQLSASQLQLLVSYTGSATVRWIAVGN